MSLNCFVQTKVWKNCDLSVAKGEEIQMSSQKIISAGYILIFFVATSLRLALALTNRESNDNHIFPVRFIMLTNKLPSIDQQGESYQPKLYYYIIARVAKIEKINPGDKNGLILIGQMVNCIAGIVIVSTVFMLIKDLQAIRGEFKLIAFALAALNPDLIAINGQATNDTFVILFCSLGLYFAYIFLKNSEIIYFILSIIFVSLAIATKTNAWVTGIAISLSVFIKAFSSKRHRYLGFSYAAIFALSLPLLAFLNPLTQYAYNIRKYGQPILTTMDKGPLPPIWGENFIPEAGIVSIHDGFFTFKIIDLLKDPVINLDPEVYQSHRTSLWTQLYGRANSAHFPNWPPTWANTSKYLLWLTRVIFLLALLPTFLLLVGLTAESMQFAKCFLSQSEICLQDVDYGLFTITFAGYLAFAAVYAYEYRIFSVMKSIFVLPSLLAIVLIFIKGTKTLVTIFHKRTNELTFVFAGIIILLLSLYITDIAILINQLAHTTTPF